MSEPRSALEQALDLLVYAPLGLVLTARDELPQLIDRGRRQAGGQVSTARVVGQMAVTQGQREAEKIARQATRLLADLGFGAGASSAGSTPPPPPEPAPPPAPPAARTGPQVVVDADTLAIPGYDALSAPQVVQRLDGLAPDELEAVRAYEAATRHRRTILGRVAQLQSPSVS